MEVSKLSKEQQDSLINELKAMQRNEVVDQLDVGTIVKINHKKVPSAHQFRVTKINRKNVKVKQLFPSEGNAIYTVNPQLLEVIG